MDLIKTPRATRSALKLVTDATVDPVSLDDAKLYLRVAHSDEDGLILSQVKAAARKVKEDTRRALTTETWDQAVDRFPVSGPLEVLLSPLLTVTSITVYAADDTSSVLASSNYVVDTYSVPGRVFLSTTGAWPSNVRSYLAGVIRFTCGFGATATTVPADLLEAVKLQLLGLYQRRDLTDAEQRVYDYLIAPWKVYFVGA